MKIKEKTIPANILSISFNLKSFISFLQPQSKHSIIAYIFILCFSVLSAKEPTLAILKNVYTNNIQKFSIGNYNYICKAYGIVSIEDLYNTSIENPMCRKSIVEFFERYPLEEYFSANLLYTGQMYHIEFRDMECILHAKGIKTLSEILLYEGLALKKVNFRDEIYRERFITAQDNARKRKKGLWGTTVYKNCFPELTRNQ